MTAIATQGSTLKLSVPGSPTVFAAAPHITGFQIQATAPEIDVTDLDSLAAEKLVGVPSFSITAQFNLDPDNARHTELFAAIVNRTKLEFQIAMTDATPSTWTGEGYVTSWNSGGNVNDKIAGSVTIACNKGITKA